MPKVGPWPPMGGDPGNIFAIRSMEEGVSAQIFLEVNAPVQLLCNFYSSEVTSTE
jgi:hypothetical protein